MRCHGTNHASAILHRSRRIPAEGGRAHLAGASYIHRAVVGHRVRASGAPRSPRAWRPQPLSKVIQVAPAHETVHGKRDESAPELRGARQRHLVWIETRAKLPLLGKSAWIRPEDTEGRRDKSLSQITNGEPEEAGTSSGYRSNRPQSLSLPRRAREDFGVAAPRGQL